MTESRKLRVFLCHSSQDKPIVRELYKRLLAEGWIDPWLDEEKLLPGQRWQREIPKAVRSSDVVIVCLSIDSINKEGYVQKELKSALDVALEKPVGTIFIIPLRLEECIVPDDLSDFQWDNYYPAEHREEVFAKLLNSLQLRANTLGIKTKKPIKSTNVKKSRENLDKEEKRLIDWFRDLGRQTKNKANIQENALLEGEENESGKEAEPHHRADFYDEMLELLPKFIKESMKKEIKILKDFFKNKRPPKIMIIGRRGAGKSSLINAIFCEKIADTGDVLSTTGEAKWYSYKNQNGEMQILDTRGLGDDAMPETANFQNAIDDIKAALVDDCPDVILFLCAAKSVGSHLEDDLSNVAEIQSFIRANHNYSIPVLAVVNQVDALTPLKPDIPPYANDKKQKNIQVAVDRVRDYMLMTKIDSINVVAISTYADFDEKDRNLILDSRFWNIDILIKYLIETLPNEAQVELARLSHVRYIQTKLAKQIITTTAILCGAIAATPNFFGDIIPITSAQVSMVMGIAYIGGKESNGKSAKEFLVALGANIGAAYVFREVASALGRIVIPILGGAVSATIALTGTWAIGEAAIAYFVEKRPIDEARKIFKREYQKAEKPKTP